MKNSWIRFPRHRRIVLDILRLSRRVPSFPVDRWMNLSDLDAARRDCPFRISWAAIFIRGWGLVSQHIPDLRQSYMDRPWGYLYEHHASVASVSVHRPSPDFLGGQLIWCRIPKPEEMTLFQIQERLAYSQRGPIEEVFRDGHLLARFPSFIRNLGWDILQRWWGRKKAKMMGTFTVSTLAGQGAMNRQHPLIVTSSLAYAPLEADGRCLVTALFDHRVLDGYLAAEALKTLERTLCDQITDEIRSVSQVRSAA